MASTLVDSAAMLLLAVGLAVITWQCRYRLTRLTFKLARIELSESTIEKYAARYKYTSLGLVSLGALVSVLNLLEL